MILVIIALGDGGCRPSQKPQEPIILQRGNFARTAYYSENIYLDWPIRMRLENGAVVVLPTNQQSVQVDVPATDFDEMEKYLITRIDVLGPDGWKNSVHVLVGKREITPRQKHQPAKTIKTAGVSFPDQTPLYYDNRAHAATEINIGELDFTIPENGTGVLIFPRPAVGHDCLVRLGGQQVGTINASEHVSYFLDTSGHRVYRFTHVLYQSATNVLRPSSKPDVFKDKHLYVVEESIDYFLRHAPDSVSSEGGYATRTELTEFIPAP